MKAFLLGLIMILSHSAVFANWDMESRKIDFLIQSVEHSNVTFIRAGVEYDGHTAAQHLRDKLNQALTNPFGGNKDSFTVDDFIEKIASKSFLTGNPYLIKLPDGQTIPAHDWLYQQLAGFTL